MTDDNAAGHIIRDDKPASEWALTYPLGSGRLGACVFGGAVRETVCLNHDLLWRNYMKSQTYGTAADMPEMKRLCSEGKWGEAGTSCCALCRGRGSACISRPSYPPAICI